MYISKEMAFRGMGFVAVVFLSMFGSAFASPLDPVATIMQGGEILDLPPVKESIQPGDYGALSYDFVEHVFGPSSTIVHSGAANNDNYSFQHVYAYSTADGERYSVSNQAGNKLSVLFGPEQAGKETGKSFRVPTQYFSLDSLYIGLAKSKTPIRNKELRATFEFEITREFAKPSRKNPDRIKHKKVKKGAIDIFQTKRGKIKIRTRGLMKKKYITAVMGEGWLFDKDENDLAQKGNLKKIRHKELRTVLRDNDMILFRLDKLALPYRFRTKVGLENIVTLKLTSTITKPGSESGGEIMYIPEESPLLPVFYKNNSIIPEPVSVLFFGLGGLLLLRRKQFYIHHH